MLNSAIHMFEDIGRLSMAAKYYKVLTFIFETYNIILEQFMSILG